MLFPTPKERAAGAGGAHAFHRQAARSRRSPADPTSGQHDEQLPTYNAYSIDGDVTAPLVYVNYGVPDDYEALERAGHLREGGDRDRALRRILARHQAQGGGRARRRRAA